MIALTGGAGCGKSTVLEIFRQLGWKTFDADACCRKLYDTRDERVVTPLLSRWGEAVSSPEGGIDRGAVARMVFRNPDELRWLNSIFHPLVEREMLAAAQDGDVICDIPLLYELGWETRFDQVICVWADRETQRTRLLDRGWSGEDADARIAAQKDNDDKLEKAHIGLINVFSKKMLYEQCLLADEKLRTGHAKKKI